MTVYAQPSTNSPSKGSLFGGSGTTPPKPCPAICWAEGQHKTEGNISHNKWVLVDSYEGDDGRNNAWVWAGYLKGNEMGNVPNHC